ncbi:hypothetical protein R1flu_000857 [Riccia fluitans]|uniref:Uncharacterized protein n=1 Tax=Riccia fluitans TaxID=41844 RepID=A0ABD1Y1P1_9MARC
MQLRRIPGRPNPEETGWSPLPRHERPNRRHVRPRLQDYFGTRPTGFGPTRGRKSEELSSSSGAAIEEGAGGATEAANRRKVGGHPTAGVARLLVAIGKRQKAIEEIPLPPPGQKKKKKKTPAVQSGLGGESAVQPPVEEQLDRPLETIEEDRPDIRPCYTDEEIRRRHPELFVQPRALPPASAGAPQPTPVEVTLLDRLVKISRLEAMSGTAEEDQAVREVVRDPALPCIIRGEHSEASMARFSKQMEAVVKHWTMERAASTSDALTSVWPSVVTLAKFFLGQIPQVSDLTIHAPAVDRIDELQVLCTAVASWAGELK